MDVIRLKFGGREIESQRDINPAQAKISQMLASPCEQLGRELRDLSASFHCGHEVMRRQHAPFGVVPARQCFDTDHRAGLGINDGLQVCLEFSFFEGAINFGQMSEHFHGLATESTPCNLGI